MDDLYKKYKPGYEFEFRTGITPVQFRNMLNHISNKDGYDATFSMSVSVALDRQRLIRKYFDKKGGSKKVYLLKEEIGRKFIKHRLYGGVKATLIKETEGQEKDFKAKNIVSIRIKPRVSIVLQEEPNWRFDFTPSKEFKNTPSAQQIKSAKDELFIWPKNLNEYIQKIDLDAITGMIEMEIEYIGKETPMGTDYDYLFGLVTPTIQDANNSDYYKILQRIISLLKRRTVKNPTVKHISNQVKSLDHVTFRDKVQAILHSFDILFKTDGTRALCLIEDEAEHILTNKNHKFESKHNGPTIYDGEFDEEKGLVRLFDVMMWEGVDLTGKAFNVRKKYFKQVIAISSVAVEKKILVPTADNSGKQIIDFYEKPPNYKIDGLILTPRFGDYFGMTVYKWKPLEHMTIDFLIKRCPVSMAGKKPYIARPNKTTYLLFCGARQEIRHKFLFPVIQDYHQMFPTVANADYRPTLFQHPQNHYDHIYYGKENLDGKIGEFLRDKSGEWKLIRIREDRQLDVQSGRYFGNDYMTASSNYDNYYDPLTLTDLAGSIDHGYFAGDNEAYREVRKFNSFVKEYLIHRHIGAKSVIDLAGGQGQDLMRYSKMNVDRILIVDIDRHAIARLNSRRFNIPNPMAIWTMITDLTLPKANNYAQIIRHFELPQVGVDLMVCNLALHYMSQTMAKLKNILGLVDMLLAKDKQFLATFFDGQLVMDLVAENKGEWKVPNPDGTLRYSIRGKPPLKNWGSEIEVILPFSNGQHYKEPLINFTEFKKVAEKMKFNVETGLFSDFFEDKDMPELTGDDKTFAGLYRWVVLTHMVAPKKLAENLRAIAIS